jgi:hypothetical protein
MAKITLAKGTFECLNTNRLGSVIEKYSDFKGNLQICEHIEGKGNIEYDKDTPLVIFHTEGDPAYIDIDYFNNFGKVIHCNANMSKGIFFNYWAYDYLTHIKELGVQTNNQNTFAKKFLCLNGRPDWHRYYTLQMLYDTGLYDTGLVSFLNRYNQLNNNYHYNTFKEMYKKDTPEIDHMRDRHSHLVVDRSNSEIHKNDRLHNKWIYEETSISLVTETYPEASRGLFITEKTWKPIANCHLALYIGQPNLLEFLRQQGYDTFDDILDNTYDTIHEDISRFNSAIHSLSKYLNSIDSIDKNDIQQRLKYNQQRFLQMKISNEEIQTWL